VRVHLLREVPDLARRLPPDEVSDATSRLTAATLELPPGPWQAPLENRPGHLGFLVLDGIIVREICIGPDWSSELLGRGDLLRPWQEDAASFVESRWQVLDGCRLALLDPSVARQIARHPVLIGELLERALRRGRSMAVHAVIEGVHRIDQRLLLLMWHLAEQHGTRTNGEVLLPIRLTHEHLSRLVGARRPTVTTALGALEADGKVGRTPEGSWVLRGAPPARASLATQPPTG
jgi:CRP/FNR family transcriptional regulator, cyclic AMP receptor protein